MAMQMIEQEAQSVDQLEREAWAVCNAGYASPNRAVYLVVGQELYREAMQARIRMLFERGDEQNARLSALGREQRRKRRPGKRRPRRAVWSVHLASELAFM